MKRILFLSLMISWLQAGDLVAAFIFFPTTDPANARLDTSEEGLRRAMRKDVWFAKEAVTDFADCHVWGQKHRVAMKQDVLDLLTGNPFRETLKSFLIDPSKPCDDDKHAFSYGDIVEILFNSNTQIYEEQGRPGKYNGTYLKFILAGILHPKDGADPILGYAVLVFRKNKVFWDLIHCCFQGEDFEDIIAPSPIGRYSRPVTARASLAYGPLKFFDIKPVDFSGDIQRDQDEIDIVPGQSSASQTAKSSKAKKRSGWRRYNMKKKAKKRLFAQQALEQDANIEEMVEKL